MSMEPVTQDSGDEMEVLDDAWGGGGGVEDEGGGGELPRNYQVPSASVTVAGCRTLQYLTLILTVLFCAANCFHCSHPWERT